MDMAWRRSEEQAKHSSTLTPRYKRGNGIAPSQRAWSYERCPTPEEEPRMCVTHIEHQLGANEVCLQCLWERQAGDSPRRCPWCGGYLCSEVCEEDHVIECQERPSTSSESDDHAGPLGCRVAAAQVTPAPRCLQRCASGYSGPHHCVQLCKHARGHHGSHDCMQHQRRPKRPPPGPPPTLKAFGAVEEGMQLAEDRPPCQCWCGCRRRPGRNCRLE